MKRLKISMMHPIAQELNTALKNTVAVRLLSELGRELYFPKGIVFQSAQAATMAGRFNATVGLSCENGSPMILPSVARYLPDLSPTEAVSYAPPMGVEELRETWKKEMLRKNPSLSPDTFSLPLVVPGLTCGISLAADIFLGPGMPVVIPDMNWDNYSLIFETRRGARLCTFPTFEGGGFNVQGLERAILMEAREGRAAVLLNFPNNPTGYTPTRAEAAAIVKALSGCAERGLDILVLVDDAYYGLFYEPECMRESLFAPLSAAHERILAVKVDGSTKEDFVWGFRVAFLCYGCKGLQKTHYNALLQKTAGALRSTVSNSSRPAQSILLRAMRSKTFNGEKAEKLETLHRRYRKVKDILKARATGRRLKELPFNSGYFMSFLCDGLSAEALRVKLLERGIGTIAMEDRYLRVAYASVDEQNLQPLYDELFETADELAGR